MSIAETFIAYLPTKRRKTPSGWTVFNSVCCVHNGTGADTRQRGGFIVNGGQAISYHCFNCGFKASWQPGRAVSNKLKRLMQWINVPDSTVNQLCLQALRTTAEESTAVSASVPEFVSRSLPMGAMSMQYWAEYFKQNPTHADLEKWTMVAEYAISRSAACLDQFYWTAQAGFNQRLIVPFMYQGRCVGWTARAVTEHKQRYISEQSPGFVFNLDAQNPERKYLVVCEGPFDALSVGAAALLGSNIHPAQQQLINQQNKTVILVPDRDAAGAKTMVQAVDMGWSVSLPPWPPGVKDINDAAIRLGPVATLAMILEHQQKNPVKIKLLSRNYFDDHS